MNTEREIAKDYREIKDDYSWHPDIFTKDNERVDKVKEIINTRLSVVDKTIIILYADCQSYRKLGQRLGVSHMTIRREVQRIKKIILEEYQKEERK